MTSKITIIYSHYARVLRGGAFYGYFDDGDVRAADRLKSSPDEWFGGDLFGFRCARSAEG